MASRHGRMTDLDPAAMAVLMDAQNAIEQGRAAGVNVEDTGDTPVPMPNRVAAPQMNGFSGNVPNATRGQISLHAEVTSDKASRACPPKAPPAQPDLHPVAAAPGGPAPTAPPVSGSDPSWKDALPDVRISSKQSFSGTPYSFDAPDGSPVAEIVWCPTHGLFYDGKVYGQPLRMIDLLTVEGMTDANKMDSLSAILSRRIFGVSPDEITLADEVFFLQWLRASSYPDDIISVPGFTCPRCKSDIDEPDYGVNFKYLSFNTDNDPDTVFALYKGAGYYPFRMSDGTEIRMFITRRVHDRITAEYMANRSGTGTSGRGKYTALPGVPDDIVAPLANMASFIEIAGCEGMDKKVNYLANLSSGEDMSILRNAINAGQLRTTVKAKLVCPRCHEVTETALPFSLAEYISGL